MTETEIRDALRGSIDPELGVNIVDLGLVSGVEIDGGRVRVAMTMTTPACPLGDYLRDLVESGIPQRIPGVESVDAIFLGFVMSMVFAPVPACCPV